ncbi:hypothetical protein Bpfe_024924 [Biomphalaria pfeifferi]|uniref:Uncharacterized protein n=1 Tax=Biomphalaria pfeifferi TaxID=112525 RepID=A0AAD8B098_BIOPF|nr:hypothetical protein Bpfe_024924 [Biomphalaria pfeifferi]
MQSFPVLPVHFLGFIIFNLCMTAVSAQKFRAINFAIRGSSCNSPLAAIYGNPIDTIEEDLSTLLITTIMESYADKVNAFNLYFSNGDTGDSLIGSWTSEFSCSMIYGFEAQKGLGQRASCMQTENAFYFYVIQRAVQPFKNAIFYADVTLDNGTKVVSNKTDGPLMYEKLTETLFVDGKSVPISDNRIVLTSSNVHIRYCVSPLETFTGCVYLNDRSIGRFNASCFVHDFQFQYIYRGHLLVFIIRETSTCMRQISRHILMTPG